MVLSSTRWSCLVPLLSLFATIPRAKALALQKMHENQKLMEKVLPLVFKRPNTLPVEGPFEHVGEGGLGVVFKARLARTSTAGSALVSARDPQVVAIKVIPIGEHTASPPAKPQEIKSELDEAMEACSTMRNLRNANTPGAERLIDCFGAYRVTHEDADMASISSKPDRFAFAVHVLEWAGTAVGGSSGMIRTWGQPNAGPRLVLIARQMLLALHHVHTSGKVVLDVKFRNVCMVTEVLGYPFIKLIDFDGIADNTPEEAVKSHVATSDYLDRYLLMMKQKTKKQCGNIVDRRECNAQEYCYWTTGGKCVSDIRRGAFFCGTKPREYMGASMPAGLNAMSAPSATCPFGWAQDVWSVGVSLLRELCNVERFPVKKGQMEADARREWNEMDKDEKPLYERFPTKASDFFTWLHGRAGRREQRYTNFCESMTEQQLAALWGMLQPQPWERQSPAQILQSPLFAQKANEPGFVDARALAVGQVLESGHIKLDEFLRHKKALDRPSVQWKEGKKFVAFKTELNADAKGLKLEWSNAKNSEARYIHLVYVKSATVPGAGAKGVKGSKVEIMSNRTDVSGCVDIHDKSCKHPEDSASPAKRREKALTVSFATMADAVAFADALTRLAKLQRQVTPFPVSFTSESDKSKTDGPKSEANAVASPLRRRTPPKIVGADHLKAVNAVS